MTQLPPPMLKLVVLVVGTNTATTVTISEEKRVYDLCCAIKEQCPSEITCEARYISLYLAKKNEVWMDVDDPDVIPLLFDDGVTKELLRMTKRQEPLSPALVLSDAMENAPMGANKVVHLLAIHSKLHAQLRYHPMALREKRWACINELLEQHAKNQKLNPGEYSTSFRSDKSAHRPLEAVFPRKTLPEAEIDALYGSVHRINKALKVFPDGSADVCKFLVMHVLAHVCSLFDDAECHLNLRVTGKRVHTDVAFDVVVRRGDRYIGVINAPDDFSDPYEACLLGCEVVADVYRLSRVFGIVVSGYCWHFYRSDDEFIETQADEITTQEVPTRESVGRIAEIIYALLLSEVNPRRRPSATII